jgi:hypothetical protein
MVTIVCSVLTDDGHFNSEADCHPYIYFSNPRLSGKLSCQLGIPYFSHLEATELFPSATIVVWCSAYIRSRRDACTFLLKKFRQSHVYAERRYVNADLIVSKDVTGLTQPHSDEQTEAWHVLISFNM